MNIESIVHPISEQEKKLSNNLDVINYDDLSSKAYCDILNLLYQLNEYVDRVIENQKPDK